MNLHFTSGHHLEADGQTKQMNQTLKQYLHMYCNYQQDNWSELLPLAEFMYNNALSETTSVTLFFANKGYHPSFSIHVTEELNSGSAQTFVTNMEVLHQELRKHILAAQEQYQKSANRHCSPAPQFCVGDNIYVRAEFLQTTCLPKKLSEKMLGPYPIIAQAGWSSYTLHLPNTLHSVHPVFHISMLELTKSNTIPNWMQHLPPLVDINGELEFEITEILDSKFDNWRHLSKLLYLVRWTGYKGTDEETSWLLATELGNASELVADFHAAYPNKPSPLRT